MKLQKVYAYNYDNKQYFKYTVILPEKLIYELDWDFGCELEAKKVNEKIQISFISPPVKNRNHKTIDPKMSYNEFKEKIQMALVYRDEGATWTELRDHLKLEQVVPNNKWVRKLEKDIGLKRIKNMKGVVWRISHV